jgi:GT2 family glycosyltransferase
MTTLRYKEFVNEASRQAPGVAGTVSALIVWYDEPPEMIQRAVRSLHEQSVRPQEILIFNDGPVAQVDRLEDPGSVRPIGDGGNHGYFAGISRAISLISTDYLLVLNPDAEAEPGALETLVATAEDDPRIAIAGAQIMLSDGRRTNAGHNPLHPSGISVSGRYGQAREPGPPRDVASSSGACWLVRRSAFHALGGLVDELFLYYHEDVDLAWRALIGGMRVVFCPEAGARHDYDFSRRKHKWYLLERNRLFSVLANYQRRTLLLLAPALLATEVGLLLVAAREGWLYSKLRGYLWLMRHRRLLSAHRRSVQALRRRSDREVLRLFTDRLESPLLPGAGTRLLNLVWVPYMRAARALLR